MKKFITLTIGIAFSALSFGKTVSINDAKTVGYNFLAKRVTLTDTGALQLAYTGTSQVNGAAIIDFYVFNAVAPGAFIMVAADDNIKPILAYSDESVFGTTNIPSNITWWLDGYKKQINYVITNNIVANNTVRKAWDNTLNKAAKATTTVVVSPLLHTKWDQEPYYNALCPFDAGSNLTTVTGCVATAMAQVVKYWNWPVTGAGVHSYTDPTYGAQSANFGATTYQWGSMPNTVSGNNNAVATLMYHLGVSVNMQYGTDQTDGSGAWVLSAETDATNCSEFALKTYFGYKHTLHGVQRVNYADTDWINLVETELNAHRPILYVGYGGEGGHCWVGDGYENNNYVHFNWGWSGASNAYYSVDNLAPPALGAGGGDGNFNTGQEMVIGIQPDSSITANANTAGTIKLNNYLSSTASPTGYGQPLAVTTNIINSDTTTFTGSFCALIYDTAGNFMDTLQTLNAQTLAANGGVDTVMFATTGAYNMVPGIYTAHIYYRALNDTQWTPVANSGYYFNYTTLAIANDTDIQLWGNTSITQNNIVSDTIRQGYPISVNVNVGNGSYINSFTGNLDVSLYNINTGVKMLEVHEDDFVQISAYSAYSNSYTTTGNITLDTGRYILAVKHQYAGDTAYNITGSTFHANPVVITVVPQADTTVTPPPTTTANINKQTQVTVYPNPASTYISVSMQGMATTATEINIIDVAGRKLRSVPANGQANIQIPVADLASGLYYIQLQTGNSIITKKVSIVK